MSLFIGLQNAHLIQAGKVILKACQWQIHQGERFALIGRNGVGKSTLMQVLSNHLALDSGVIHFQKGLTVASLPQDLTKSFGETVFDDIFERIKQQGGLVASIQKSDFTVFESHIILHARFHDDPHLLHFVKEFNELVAVMQLGLHMPFLGLSGGMKRRCALIAALLVQPDVLLLDEPTNHLDISAIMWLENYLKRYPGAVVLVTHDRFFLQAVATHIVALNDGILKQYNSSYEVYLNERAREEAEALNETNRLQQKLIQEEHWLQRGVTARRKRNQGRLKALNDLRDKVALLQKSIGVAGNWDPQLIRTGRVLVNVENISYSIGDVVRFISKNPHRILVSGTTATYGFNVIGGNDPAAQAHFIFDKIEGAIQSLGGKLEDIVRTRVFVKDINQWEAIARAHGHRFADIQPANTMVQANLIGDEYLVEIEAEAMVE
jgi:ATP-binding cassette subfamily F protein uup